MSDILNRAIKVPDILNDYTDEELNREYHSKEEYRAAIENYGCIFKVVSFSDITDVELLKKYGKEWIRRNYYDGVLSFTIKAVDLHLLGYNTDKLLCGDQIPVTFLDTYKTPVTKTLTCLSIQYDLLKPENNSYKIGIPDVSANVKYRESIQKKSSIGKKDNTNENSKKTQNETLTKIKPLFEQLGSEYGITLDLEDTFDL